uniref:PPPDE domain-containing protein n=1 Tax=Ditylenchus dipsaci TaxID=166011 RepID=A0A915EFR4_9BILA
MAFPVKLYIYEVSGGLARALSTQLLGRQIEGIWHTGVTAYGKEYFYGSHGISYVPIGSFMLGQPMNLKHLHLLDIVITCFTTIATPFQMKCVEHSFWPMLLPMMNSMMSQFNNNIQAHSENINSSSDSTTQMNPSISSTADSNQEKASTRNFTFGELTLLKIQNQLKE